MHLKRGALKTSAREHHEVWLARRQACWGSRQRTCSTAFCQGSFPFSTFGSATTQRCSCLVLYMGTLSCASTHIACACAMSAATCSSSATPRAIIYFRLYGKQQGKLAGLRQYTEFPHHALLLASDFVASWLASCCVAHWPLLICLLHSKDSATAYAVYICSTGIDPSGLHVANEMEDVGSRAWRSRHSLSTTAVAFSGSTRAPGRSCCARTRASTHASPSSRSATTWCAFAVLPLGPVYDSFKGEYVLHAQISGQIVWGKQVCCEKGKRGWSPTALYQLSQCAHS